MAFTFVEPIATDRDAVRSLIPDVIANEAIFSDARIDAFLLLEGSVKGATALSLEIISTDEALVQKVQKTADFSTDGAKTAATLLERARELRRQLTTEAAGAARRPVPVTGRLTTTAPVTPCQPPDANDQRYSGSPYSPGRRLR